MFSIWISVFTVFLLLLYYSNVLPKIIKSYIESVNLNFKKKEKEILKLENHINSISIEEEINHIKDEYKVKCSNLIKNNEDILHKLEEDNEKRIQEVKKAIFIRKKREEKRKLINIMKERAMQYEVEEIPYN